MNPPDRDPAFQVANPLSMAEKRPMHPASSDPVFPSQNRRDFLKTSLAAAAPLLFQPLDAAEPANSSPWHRRAIRWGQTNISEKDPVQYDLKWWRTYWKRTRIQGVIINAGGIVAYYPSALPLQYRAQFLKDRDLYGEVAKAAHDDGLVVLARMDSNRVHEDFFQAHPDWMARDASGQPYRAGDLYVTCINSDYYEKFIPDVLREIIQRSRPEGFADNSWSGLGRGSICYCANCSKKFQEKIGHELPRGKNWDDPIYQQWIKWNYARRTEVWDLNNRVTQEAGGPHCLWIGMNSGSVTGQSQSFRDMKEICARAEMLLLDHQARSDSGGFQENGQTGKLIHGLLGWEKLAPESMAMYQAGRPTFRKAAKPEPEARLWVLEGFAGGIQPWWHHVGAYQEDFRQFRTIEPLNRWHEANQRYLVDRQPVANVGVLWSQDNTDFFGRDNPGELVDQPFHGISQALIRARIPFVPVHADHLIRELPKLALLILPNVGALSDAHCATIKNFARSGGGLIATGETSLFTERGAARSDFALADLFGVRHPAGWAVPNYSARVRSTSDSAHSYFRLSPELRGGHDGPKDGDEPKSGGPRHAVLDGFDDTDILPFGGALKPLVVGQDAVVPLTFIPSFPVYPPETSWMRTPRTDIPGLVLRDVPGQGRVAYFSADLDRRYGRDNLPDHARLLANAVRWAARDSFPLTVSGPGLIDCHLYEQPGRLILHLINLTNAAAWRAPMEDLIAIGPFLIRVKLPKQARGGGARFLVSGGRIRPDVKNGWAEIPLRVILDHEVVVIES